MRKENTGLEILVYSEHACSRSDAVWECIISFLVAFGMASFVCELTDAGVPAYAFGAAVSAVFTAAFTYIDTKNKAVGIVAASVSFVLPAFFLFRFFINGLVACINSAGILIGSCCGIITPAFDYIQKVSVADSYIFIGIVVCMTAILSCIVLKNHRPYFFAFLLILELVLSIFAGEFFKLSVIFLIIALIFSSLGKLWRSQNSAKAFQSKAAVLLLAFAVSCLSFIPTDFKAFEVKEKDVLPQGDFTQTPIKRQGKGCLEVVMDKPQSYYLRGFVGEKYTGQGWKNIDNEEKYKNADLFYWLHKSNFYGQTQLSALADLTDSQQTNRIIVKNLGVSDKYIYAPYETMEEDNQYLRRNKIGDERLYGTEKSYRLYCSQNHVKDYTVLAQNLSKNESNENFSSYIQCEAHYNEYVYNNYLQITDKQKTLLKDLLGEYNPTSHMKYADAKEKILGFLTSEMSYTDKPQSLSDDDFVCSFLEKSHKGNSQHFASAATIMFRYLGIPARYVEGYLITPQDVENGQANTPITLDDSHAHIWTEFYQDGVGWIPFEVSPPYLNIMEKADDITGIAPDINNGSQQSESDDRNTNSQQAAEQMQRQPDKNYYIIIYILMVLAVVLLCIFAFMILKRKMRLKHIKNSFEIKDRPLAVINMFAYSVKLLQTFKILNGVNQAYDGKEILFNMFGKDYAELYIKVQKLYNRVKFGYNENISDIEWKIVRLFEEKTISIISERRNVLQRFIDKYIRFIY
ncbi:MAG: transglutaminase domain-containing protein [Oscillospiraceae bacterium]